MTVDGNSGKTQGSDCWMLAAIVCRTYPTIRGRRPTIVARYQDTVGEIVQRAVSVPASISDGSIWTTHTLLSKNGHVIDGPHIRPGYPKYGQWTP
jgi:hypothetical protein